MLLSRIKEDMETLSEKTGIYISYLEKETDLKESMRYVYSSDDVESFDDRVDVVEFDFLLNVYLEDNLLERQELVMNVLRELNFYDVKLIDTMKEESSYNTAFTFSKKYYR